MGADLLAKNGPLAMVWHAAAKGAAAPDAASACMKLRRERLIMLRSIIHVYVAATLAGARSAGRKNTASKRTATTAMPAGTMNSVR